MKGKHLNLFDLGIRKLSSQSVARAFHGLVRILLAPKYGPERA